MEEEELKGTPLQKLTEFYCPKYNLTIEITHPKSLTDDPRAYGYPDRKMVQFRNGWYSTDDPVIIKALDKRSDVYRSDDPRVAALEEVNLQEPEDKASALRLLERHSSIGSFEKPRVNVPSLVTRGD